MRPEYFDRFARINAVEREYSASRLASDRLMVAVEQDPTILGRSRELRVRDVRDASERLEGTYIIHLFAEFESAVRAFWSRARSSESPLERGIC